MIQPRIVELSEVRTLTRHFQKGGQSNDPPPTSKTVLEMRQPHIRPSLRPMQNTPTQLPRGSPPQTNSPKLDHKVRQRMPRLPGRHAPHTRTPHRSRSHHTSNRIRGSIRTSRAMQILQLTQTRRLAIKLAGETTYVQRISELVADGVTIERGRCDNPEHHHRSSVGAYRFDVQAYSAKRLSDWAEAQG